MLLGYFLRFNRPIYDFVLTKKKNDYNVKYHKTFYAVTPCNTR